MDQNRGPGLRLMIGLVMAAFALFSYYSFSSKNTITGEKQHISLSKDQEIALGLKAAPTMIHQFGGEVQDSKTSGLVDKVGNRLFERSSVRKTGYKFDFHLLADDHTINAFALPGGQVFITDALAKKLKTEGQLAGVLGHEMGHVAARHSAEQLAKQNLTQGLVGAVATGSNGGESAQLAAAVASMVNLKYSRGDELEADALGVRFMSEAGYDPHSMVSVMEVLEAASKGNKSPEFFSTHPNPEHRIPKIKAAIQKQFPNGVPQGLER